ncbi:SusC/RagA family TonB-linked outer membrane protein [Chryseobacterium sp. Marseille-Q8038]
MIYTIKDNGKRRSIPRKDQLYIVTHSNRRPAMRTTIFYMFLLLFLACTKVTAQKIVLFSKDTPFKSVIQQVQKQSGYSFAINDRHMRMAKTVTISAQDKDLKEVLNEIFSSQPFGYIIDGKVIISVDRGKEPKTKTPLEKEQEPIKGKVSNEKGEALAGASVRIKGTTVDFFTDANGRFEIPANYNDAVLQVSYIGYAITEVSASEASNIFLSLSNNTIDIVDVVSTGYQTLPKERSTGSFATVGKKLFNEQVGTDVLSRLEYITNGVSVFRNNATTTSQLMVRGLSTINGPSGPLVVVDNFPYEGDINNINPNDVENITVLKDAAASSIWGSRAGNGVIVITTKKGKFNQPLSIEVNSNIKIGNKPNLSYLTPMSSNDLIDMEKFLFDKGFYNSEITNINKPVLSNVVELLTKLRNGNISQQEADEKINSFRNLDVRDDFSKYIYEKSVNQQYYLNMKGGANKITYLFSTGYDKNIDNLSTRYDRLNLRTEASFKPLSTLQMNVGIQFTNSNNKSGKIGYSEMFKIYQMLADENGNAIPVPQTYSQSYKDSEMSKGQLLDWNYYALNDHKNSSVKNNTQDVLATFAVNYNIIQPLSIDLRYQYEKQQDNKESLFNQNSYFVRNLINSFSQVNRNKISNIIPKGGIYDQNDGNLTSNSFRLQLNFDKTWKEHNTTIIVGEEVRQINKILNRYRTYGYQEDVLTSSFVDYQNLYPNYVTNQMVRIPTNNGFSKTVNRFVSFYTNAAYTYKKKYTFSGSMRRDASNIFGVNTNDKWTPLWSSGVSWLLSDEKFYKTNLISFLKLRATYGFSGNIDPSLSAVTTIAYNSVPSEYTGTPVSQIRNFYNPELRWEKVRTTNLGLDFRAKDNLFWGSIDFYQKKATDLYGEIPVDYTVGLINATITKNTASMKGNGLDVELNSININKKFKWETVLNFNYYKDKVTNYYLRTFNGSSYVNNTKIPREGFPVWALYAYKFDGLDNLGNPQGFIKGESSIDYTSLISSGTTVDDLIYGGPRLPVYYGSLGNTFSYGPISATIRFTYSFGNNFRRQSINYSSAAVGTSTHSDYVRRWQKPGDELITDVPSFVYPLNSSRDNFYYGSESLIEKADCIRLQYINISYSVVPLESKRSPFKNLQLFLNANNLGIIWRANKYGIDPDYAFTGSTFPSPKNIAIGFRAEL